MFGNALLERWGGGHDVIERAGFPARWLAWQLRRDDVALNWSKLYSWYKQNKQINARTDLIQYPPHTRPKTCEKENVKYRNSV